MVEDNWFNLDNVYFWFLFFIILLMNKINLFLVFGGFGWRVKEVMFNLSKVIFLICVNVRGI